MSNLDELIAELCPSGVKYVPLKQIAEVGTGSSDRVNAVDDGEYPFYVRSKNILCSNRYLFDEEAIIIPGEGGIGDIFHYVNGKYDLHQRAYRIHLIDPNVNTKFTYYCLSANFKKFIIMKAVNATVTSIRKPMIENFRIPLPPLPVQQEIVRILDNFTDLTTDLTTELTAELTARRKQYEYYRDLFFEEKYYQLLRLEKNFEVQKVPLSDVGKFIRGKRFVKSDMINEGTPCIHYGELYTHYGVWTKQAKSFISSDLASKLRFARKGNVIIVATGETVEDIGKGVAWLADSDVVVHDACYIFEHNLNPKYVSYFLRTRAFHSQIKRYISTGKISSISSDGLGKAIIPIPPLGVQKNIVRILDQFDALCNDLTSILPAEIEARQKQYEYYRDKLLTFKEVTA